MNAVRGKRLMIAIESSSIELCQRVQQFACESGLLVGSAGACLKIASAFTISGAPAARVVATLHASLAFARSAS